MPNIRSAMKRMRSDAKKQALNQAAISELKNYDKKLKKFAAEPEKALALAKQAISRYDRAVSRGIIPRGRADRRKSRISAFVSKIQASK